MQPKASAARQKTGAVHSKESTWLPSSSPRVEIWAGGVKPHPPSLSSAWSIPSDGELFCFHAGVKQGNSHPQKLPSVELLDVAQEIWRNVENTLVESPSLIFPVPFLSTAGSRQPCPSLRPSSTHGNGNGTSSHRAPCSRLLCQFSSPSVFFKLTDEG